VRKLKKSKGKNGGKMQGNSRLIKKVAEIYDRLDLKITSNSDLAGKCRACGRCCDFVNFDHWLFVTPPEIMYLAANLGAEGITPMLTSQCPYNIDGKCSIYKYRFAGCRIFYCKGDSATRLADKKDFQGQLSESALKKFKSICDDFQIPYHYIDLATALNNFAGT
jgi:Fe-S-cluster containining protein